MQQRSPALGLALVVLGAPCSSRTPGCPGCAAGRASTRRSLTTPAGHRHVPGAAAWSPCCSVATALRAAARTARPARGRARRWSASRRCSGPTSWRSTGCRSGMALLLEYQAPILVALWARLRAARAGPPAPVGSASRWPVVGLAAATGIWNGRELRQRRRAGRARGGALLRGVLPDRRGTAWPARPAAGDPLVLRRRGRRPEPRAPADRRSTGTCSATRRSLLGALARLHAPVWAVLAWIVLVGTLLPFGLILLALRAPRRPR